MEEEKPKEEPKKEEMVEKKQERDWRLDEDFKKFMSSPSIESALKLERKRAEERLREINSQEQGNFFSGVINFFVKYCSALTATNGDFSLFWRTVIESSSEFLIF